MFRKQTMVGAIALAGVAFVAGRISLSPGVESTAQAAPAQIEEYTKKVKEKADALLKPAQEMEIEITPEMQAYIEAGAPGPHHRHLDQLVGDWEGVVRIWMAPDAPMQEWPAEVSRKWILDGRFVEETVESQSPIGTFIGRGVLGYNNVDGQYEFVWMENMSTSIMFGAGHYNPDTHTLASRGTHRDPATGKVVSSRSEIDMSDPDRSVFIGWAVGADGREFKNMEGEFKRVN